MTPEEIIERFAGHGIKCRVDRNCVLGCIPVYNNETDSVAYVIEGENVLVIDKTKRVLVPLFDNPTAEHVDKLSMVVKYDNVTDAILVVRSPNVVGMCVFVNEDDDSC